VFEFLAVRQSRHELGGEIDDGQPSKTGAWRRVDKTVQRSRRW
jgi:hypothetical protein